MLLAGTLAAFSVHLLATHVPVTQRVLRVAPLELPTLAALVVLASSVAVPMELHKRWWRRRGASLSLESDSRHGASDWASR